jgi:hypothetical protein
MPFFQNIQQQLKRGTNQSGLLFSREEIDQRHHRKLLAVLAFLRINTYSTADILGEVMNLNARTAIAALPARHGKKHLVAGTGLT